MRCRPYRVAGLSAMPHPSSSVAQSRRSHFARRLLDDSELSVADVAFASGFDILRQFNRAMRVVFRASPRELRSRRRRADRLVADGGLTMRLPVQSPFDWDSMLAFFAERALPGVESIEDRVYRRTISLDAAAGVLEVYPGGEDHLLLRAHLPYWEGLIHVVERVGRMAGIDADIGPAVAHLADDLMIGTLVTDRPGLRVPGAWGPLEVAVQAITAQDCGLDRTRAQMGTLVRGFGQPVSGLGYGLTHIFPSAEVLAGAHLASVDLSQGTAMAIQALAAGVVSGDVVLDSSIGLTDLVTSLTAIPGVEMTAAHQIALRLGHLDAFPECDPAVVRALRTLAVPGPAEEIASRWQPWRAVAAT